MAWRFCTLTEFCVLVPFEIFMCNFWISYSIKLIMSFFVKNQFLFATNYLRTGFSELQSQSTSIPTEETAYFSAIILMLSLFYVLYLSLYSSSDLKMHLFSGCLEN